MGSNLTIENPGDRSEQITILTAELDLSRRRVVALIGELKLHLDRGNQLAEEMHRNRNNHHRHLQWVSAERAAERAFYRRASIVQMLVGVTGWAGFLSLIWTLIANH